MEGYNRAFAAWQRLPPAQYKSTIGHQSSDKNGKLATDLKCISFKIFINHNDQATAMIVICTIRRITDGMLVPDQADSGPCQT